MQQAGFNGASSEPSAQCWIESQVSDLWMQFPLRQVNSLGPQPVLEVVVVLLVDVVVVLVVEVDVVVLLLVDVVVVDVDVELVVLVPP